MQLIGTHAVDDESETQELAEIHTDWLIQLDWQKLTETFQISKAAPPHGCFTYMIQVDPVDNEATVDGKATKAACILPVTSNNINTTYIEQVPSEL
jgi:hypothetical protein